MLWLALISLTLARASPPEWSVRGFHPPSSGNKYFVGISTPMSTIQDAIRDARRAAVAMLLEQEFAARATVATDISERTTGTVVQRRSSVSVEDLDLTGFEAEDQVIDEVTVEGRFVVRTLFRIPEARVRAERSRLAGLQSGSSTPKSVAPAIEEAHRADEARLKEEAEYQELVAWLFPAVAVDFTVGYTRFKETDFAGLALGGRGRLFPLVYLGLEGHLKTYGTARKPGVRRGDDSGDLAFGAGPHLRVHLSRSTGSLFLKAFTAWELYVPTCPKSADGKCSSPASGKVAGWTYGAGLGIGSVLALELLYGGSTSREIGYVFSFNLVLSFGVSVEAKTPSTPK